MRSASGATQVNGEMASAADNPDSSRVIRQAGRPPRAGRAAPRRRKPAALPPAGPKPASKHAAIGGRRAGGSPSCSSSREELSGRFAELQWDLGGMTYEMASRDHYRLDVLNKQAARLQEVDAELGQIERLLKLGTAGATGTCPQLRCATMLVALIFCWQCGNELKPPTEGATKAEGK